MFVLSLQVAWGVASLILLQMQCVPHVAIWEFYLPRKCHDLPILMLTGSSIQVFSDVCMVLLPQKIVWGLNMNWQKKMGFSFLFGVGVLQAPPSPNPHDLPLPIHCMIANISLSLSASVAACIRLHVTVAYSHEEDGWYYIGPLLFWACAEMTCGFFVLSVPCIPQLIGQSSIPRRIKSTLGLGTGLKFNGAGSGSFQLSKQKKQSRMPITPEPYFQLGESRGTKVSSSAAAESQERLQREDEERQNAAGSGKLFGFTRTAFGVTRTTEVSVVTNPANAKCKGKDLQQFTEW